MTLEFGFGYELRTLYLGPSLLTLVPLCLLFFPLEFFNKFVQRISFRGTGWFSFDHPLPNFLTFMLNSQFWCCNLYSFVRLVVLINFLLGGSVDR